MGASAHCCSLGPCGKLCAASSESEEQLLQRAYTAFESTVSPRAADRSADSQQQRLMALLHEKCAYLPAPLALEERGKLDQAVLGQCGRLEVGQEFIVDGTSRRAGLSENWSGIWFEEAERVPSPELSYAFAVLRSVQLQDAADSWAVVLAFDPSPGGEAGAPQPVVLRMSFPRRVDMLRFALTVRALRSLATRAAPRGRRKASKRKGSKTIPPPPALLQVVSDSSPINAPLSDLRNETDDTEVRPRSPSSSAPAVASAEPPDACSAEVDEASELGELREQLAAARIALEASDHAVAAMLGGDSDVERSGYHTPPTTKGKKRASPARPKVARVKRSPLAPRRRISEPDGFFHTWPESPHVSAAASSSPRGSGDGDACIICISAPSCMAFVPCGHRCLCRSCGRERAGELGGCCPQCRASFTGIIRIYG